MREEWVGRRPRNGVRSISDGCNRNEKKGRVVAPYDHVSENNDPKVFDAGIDFQSKKGKVTSPIWNR